jgi:hypothetical protein
MASILMIVYMILTEGVYRLFIHTLPLSIHPFISEFRVFGSLRAAAAGGER